ncbi:MAG: heme biosynthesis protein HemY [Gammaproteobacteria bacterium]|nr:heme biosynthesis protein HemY [Gammaproteobacteria bacterium]
MKRVALLLAAALVLGGLLGVLVARDPGYVLVSYRDVAVESSLWVALAAVILLYLLLRLVGVIVSRLGVGRGGLRNWRERRRHRAARDQTIRGLLQMAEGHWEEARRLLEKAAPEVEAPLINYLNAARAAQEAGDAAGRDRLLRAAEASTPGARFAVGLAQAELQRDQGQWEACLATLLQLYRQAPRHGRVLRMLVDCYRQLEDWQAILELTDALHKHHVLEADALAALRIEAWRGRLDQGRESAADLLDALPRELRHEPAVVSRFAERLAASDAAAAEGLLRRALEHRWDPGLVRQYGTLTGADADARRVVAEGWLKERPNDADLLLALGRISLQLRAWAQAREYLEASLRLRRSADAQAELGRLCAAMGDGERGAELLVQAQGSLPDLPLPEPQPRGA